VHGGSHGIGILGMSLLMSIVQEGPHRKLVLRGARNFSPPSQFNALHCNSVVYVILSVALGVCQNACLINCAYRGCC
jgi:hypothetical protein